MTGSKYPDSSLYMCEPSQGISLPWGHISFLHTFSKPECFSHTGTGLLQLETRVMQKIKVGVTILVVREGLFKEAPETRRRQL